MTVIHTDGFLPKEEESWGAELTRGKLKLLQQARRAAACRRAHLHRAKQLPLNEVRTRAVGRSYLEEAHNSPHPNPRLEQLNFLCDCGSLQSAPGH